ncbi:MULTISPECIES: hypothetical protein [unclassified Salinibacterium]|uniref:hypothetical protein n=1 Tax=unclassified Salinibacterium TaxID=2632331 RepID=UPI0018CCFA76|nr:MULTISPECIES: hypothetical protein [unclassified Salinibacterium]MBH0054623.1 hypothetical protein [Salinibacterium sp. SWN139]MBH0084225.1 hypothetical protein [Salinibacterium sp. SWN167]
MKTFTVSRFGTTLRLRRYRAAAVVAAATFALTACTGADQALTPELSPAPAIASNSATLTWGMDATAPDESWQKPALGSVETDPVYGTTIQRVTSADGTRFDRNSYSRRQAENADGSLFFTYHGDAEYHVYSTADASLVSALDIHPDAEPQWHPTDPHLIRYLEGPNSSEGDLILHELDVTSGQSTVIADLREPLSSAFPDADYMKDRSEGSPSSDGTIYAWIVYNADEQPLGMVSYDLASDTVLGTSELPADTDWVSASPTGTYVVASAESGTYVYDADLSNQRLLTEASEHSDIALSADGRDAYVYIDFDSASETAGFLTSVDMDSLERTTLFDAYDDANTSMHISGKGYDKPGWVVVSTYNCNAEGAWTCEKVMAIELDGGRILNLAHTYNCGEDYWTETHAVVNRSFTHVYFNSDGGSCGMDAEVYRLDVPVFD